MNKHQILKQYDEIGKSYLSAQHAFYREIQKDEPRNFIYKNLGNIRGKRLLDVGCGDGTDISYFRKIGAGIVYGIDSSNFMLLQANKKLKSFECLLNASAENLPFNNESMDFISSRFALHYLDSLDKAFEEMSRVLVPKGKLVFVVGHPFTNLLNQENKVYGKREIISVKLYDGSVSVTNPTHTFSDYISPTFCKLFSLEKLYEGKQVNDSTDRTKIVTPGFLGIVARKRCIC